MGWSKSFHPQGFLNSLPAKRLATITPWFLPSFFEIVLASSFSDGRSIADQTQFSVPFDDLLGCAVTSSRSLNLPDNLIRLWLLLLILPGP
jgi:hypothetical protein